MTKDDWIRKLTSRKFWAAIAAFITGLIVFFQKPTGDAESITALIMSFGSVIAYIVGEGLIDAASAKNPGPDVYYYDDYYEEPEDKPPEEPEE